MRLEHPRTDPRRRSQPLVDVTAASERLGTPVRFVRRLVAERRIRFYKVGRYVRFDPADLDAWLAEHAVEPSRW